MSKVTLYDIVLPAVMIVWVFWLSLKGADDGANKNTER